MRNIKLTIEYDGSSFGGWQKQPNKLNIQGEIFHKILKKDKKIAKIIPFHVYLW